VRVAHSQLVLGQDLYFYNILLSILAAISYNVPAVCDGLAARRRAVRSKDQGRQTVPEQRRGNGAERNDLAVAEAEGPLGPEAHTDLLCDVGA
jgi:hypothetical protein